MTAHRRTKGAAAIAAALVLAGCSSGGAKPSTTPSVTAPAPAASAPAASAGNPTSSAAAARPTGALPTAPATGPTASTPAIVTTALVTTLSYDLGMTPALATCVAGSIQGSLTAAEKEQVVAGWRKSLGQAPRPISVPTDVLQKARIATDGCATRSVGGPHIQVTPVR